MVTVGFDLDEAVLQEDINHPPDWSSRGSLVELYFSLPVFLRIDSQDLLRSPEGWQLRAPILQFATAIPTVLHQLTRSRDSVYDAPGVGPCVRFALVGPNAVEIDSQVSKSMAVVPRDALGPTVVSNQLVAGPGATGATVTWGIKGGGKGLPFHYHIHRYNWYTPWTWFKSTPIIKK